MRPYLKKPITHRYTHTHTHTHTQGLVEWLKVLTLSSNPSTTKKQNKQKKG
jgi:hypothetical protein